MPETYGKARPGHGFALSRKSVENFTSAVSINVEFNRASGPEKTTVTLAASSIHPMCKFGVACCFLTNDFKNLFQSLARRYWICHVALNCLSRSSEPQLLLTQ